jgi:PTH1 family peptidyl-tRNA hydrolase
MRLIVGLGNPGKEYEWSRHNLGFMLIDKLGADAGIGKYRRECQALVARAEIETCAVQLVKPQTYMNLSGEAVGCLLAKQELEQPGENLIVISDDLALPFGKIRIRALGSNEFTRLRIGIQPEHPISDSKRFVLDSFPLSTRPEVEKILATSADAVRAILRHGVLQAMTEYNSKEVMSNE